MSKYFLLVLIIFSSSCSLFNTNNEIKPPSSSIDSVKVNLSNQSMSIGPDFDSSKCEIKAECDCCMSDLLFIDNKRFVYIAYCLESDSYLKGIYEANNTTITLHFDGKEIIKEHNLDEKQDSIELSKPEFTLSDTTNKPTILIIKKYACGKNFYYKMGKEQIEYGTFSKEGSVKEAIENMKKEQIWQKFKW